jgi:hypothetical protein
MVHHSASEEDEAAQDEFLDPAALLCHYTRADTAFSHILPSGRLRMNPYMLMRDPLESRQPHFWVPNGGLGDDAEFSLYTQVVNALGYRRGRLRLLSLTRGDERPGTATELPFRCPWARARMWEQYADNHSGVCLVFDRQAMLDAIRRDLGGEYWDGPVQYTTAGFAGSAGAQIDLDTFRRLGVEQAADLHVQAHHRDLFFLKNDDWRSEFEYRVVYTAPADAKDWTPPAHDVSYGDSLRYVLINVHRFPHWHLAGAVRVIHQAGAKYRTMDWMAGRPSPGVHVGWSR